MSNKPLFELGQLVATPAAISSLGDAGVTPLELVMRHVHGDYGDICAADKRENELSIKEGFRILSAYEVGGDRYYVITEADRSSTCVLLAREY